MELSWGLVCQNRWAVIWASYSSSRRALSSLQKTQLNRENESAAEFN